MVYRLKATNGQLEVTGGEVPSALLDACRELTAREPSCEGTIVFRGVGGGAATVDFHGRFSESLQRLVRNQWAWTTQGQEISQRLEVSRTIFEIAIEKDGARRLRGIPPEVVTKFCKAFTRANPGVTARVAGLRDDNGVRLQFTGDMPSHIQERLAKRLAAHTASVDAPPAVPRRRRRWGRIIGVALGGFILLVILAERRGLVEFNVPAQPPGMLADLDSQHKDPEGPRNMASDGSGADPSTMPDSRGLEPRSNPPGQTADPGVEVQRVPSFEEWPGIIEGLRRQRRSSPGDDGLSVELAEAHHAYAVSLAQRNSWAPAAANAETAVRLAPGDPRFAKDLARVLLNGALDIRQRLREGRSGGHSAEKAKQWVKESTRADPEFAAAYLVLGDIEYEDQQLKEARRAWLKAKGLDPGIQGLTERLERLEREYAAEVGMKEIQGYDFIVRYEEGVSPSSRFDVNEMLSEARRVVGGAFDYWPERRIVVLLYTPETYRRVLQKTPKWSGGYYDGKIRIPCPDGRLEVATVRGIITHEYTHAVVHDLAGGNCPLWLNEGLAEFQSARYSARDPIAESRQAARNGQLMPWKTLNDPFRSTSAKTARLGYDQAHSVVAYLADVYGFWRVRKVLTALAEGADAETALTREFHASPAELELQWRRWLGASQ